MWVTCMTSKHDRNHTRHHPGVVEHGPGSIRARYARIHTTPVTYSHFRNIRPRIYSGYTFATTAILSPITSHSIEHVSMHSSKCTCSQRQLAAPTDQTDAHGPMKRAYSRARAHGAQEQTHRTTRRTTRAPSTRVHASGAQADLVREEVPKPVEILGTGPGAVKR